MNLHLVLADSEIASVAPQLSSLHIRLSAANVEHTSGDRSTTAVVGYSTGVLLSLESVQIDEKQEPLIGRILDGKLWSNNQLQRDCELPSSLSGLIKLELHLANQSYLLVSAQGLSISFEAESNFHESLAC
jgi:hypothetical protein